MVPCLSKCYDENGLYLIMPLMKLGDLTDVTLGRRLGEGEAAHVIGEVLDFFVFFHEYVY